ncbi:MAG: SDR family NAD(P)-dependent oxidoreductase [Burkholderiaceae bacterium]
MSLKQALDLGGRKAIVTGGSRGLGLQIAEALGEMGAEVLLAARKQDELDEAVAHLAKMGVNATRWRPTWANRRQCTPRRRGAGQARALRHPGEQRGGDLGRPAADHPLDAWQKLINVNLTGVFLLTQEIGRRSMIPRKYGRILIVASIAGLRGNPPGTNHTIAYNTTKGGLVNFTRALAGEWGEHGITVNALAPGFFLEDDSGHAGGDRGARQGAHAAAPSR